MQSNSSTRPAVRMRLVACVIGALSCGGLMSAARADTATPATAAAAAVDATDPGTLIQSAAQAMLRELDAHRDEYRHDPAKINAMVDRILLPHFDTDYSARLVLGRHWNTATAEQRKRFVDAFYHSLLNNYGTALLRSEERRVGKEC